MILDSSTVVATMGTMDVLSLGKVVVTSLLSGLGILSSVVVYLYKESKKRDRRIEMMWDKLQEVVVQNTVAFKDLQGEIKLLRVSQETLQTLLMKEISR